MGPLDYEDCLHAEVLSDTEEMILLWDRTKKPNHVYWASNDPRSVIDLMAGIKDRIRVDFIPKEYVPDFTNAGFFVWAEYIDFFNNDLEKTSIIFNDYDSIQFLDPAATSIVEKVSQSCAGHSRGFTGETEEWFQNWMNENNIIVTREGNEIVGFCCVSIYANGTILWIREIAVAPAHQRKGFGQRLLEQSILYGIKQGAKRGFLHADSQNRNAISLYTKCGFAANSSEGELQMIRESQSSI